jgi:hypothetical protein
LYLLAGVYLFSLLFALVSYGSPYALLGRFYPGLAGNCLLFVDSMISLYLLLGMLKRQRLALYLAIAYNLFDLINAWLNLVMIPAGQYAQIAGSTVSPAELRSDTLSASLFVVTVTLCLIANRRNFTNSSPYLF